MAKLKLRYLGGGFLPGVPSRDLSSDEVKRFGYNKLMNSGLYADNYPPEEEPLTYEEDVENLADEIEEIESIFEEDN